MPTVINTNSVSGITSITSSSFGAVQFYNSAGISSLGDINVTSVNGGPISGARNRIINGDMRIDQRNAGISSTVNTTANVYTLDRWAGYGQLTDGVFTVIRSATVPTGFTSSLLATVTTADASLGATQSYGLRHAIEGYNVSDLNWGTSSAQTVTLSFWVRSSLTGTFSGSLTNDDNNRAYPFTYTINSANTWEYKTITISGDTTGTWKKDNSGGIKLFLSFGAGSTYSGTAGAWTASQIYNVTGAVNLIGTLNATFYITGVQLEVGSVATPFERRSYGQELALCQRYYETGVTGANGGLSAGNGYLGAYVAYKVTKRATATLTQSNQNYFNIFNNNINLGNVGAAQYTVNDTNGFYHNAINNGSATIYSFTYTASIEL